MPFYYHHLLYTIAQNRTMEFFYLHIPPSILSFSSFVWQTFICIYRSHISEICTCVQMENRQPFLLAAKLILFSMEFFTCITKSMMRTFASFIKCSALKTELSLSFLYFFFLLSMSALLSLENHLIKKKLKVFITSCSISDIF